MAEISVVSTLNAARQIDHLFWWRGLVVSPPTFEEPPDAPVCARGKQSHFRQFNFDGARANEKWRGLAAHQAKAEELRQTRAYDRRGNYRRLSRSRSIFW